jgi:cellulose synthase operon protein C
MRAPCDQVHTFVDGELNASQAAQFRDHLTGCARCQEALRDALLMASLEEQIDDRSVLLEVGSPTAAHRRWRVVAVAAVPLLAAAALLVFWLVGDREPAVAVDERFRQALAPTRSIEGRSSYAGADGYRQYSVMREPDERVEEIPLDLVQMLEARGELRGVAAAHLLMGARALAERKLERAPESASTYSDRALLELDRAPERALLFATRALRLAPEHPQARWNRALALEKLGLWRMAADAFEQVARLGEPGWSAEATRRASQLETMADAIRGTWRDGLQAKERLILHGELPANDQIRATPGLMRLALYDAVRAAPSPERVLALRPLAEALDAHYGGAVLTRYVDRLAGSYPAGRAPLARLYAELATSAKASVPEQYIERALAAGQNDIALGALLFMGVDATTIEQYRALALAAGDPWFELLAEETHAELLLEQRDDASAIARLSEALERCEALRLEYRCVRLENLLARAHTELHSIAAARRHLASGWLRVRRTRQWSYLMRFLYRWADLAVKSDDSLGSQYDLAAAYLGEALLWWPDCANRQYAAKQLATVLMNQNRMDEARAQLERVSASCPDWESTVGFAFLKAHLLGTEGDAEVSALRAEIDALRRESTPGERALLDHIEGRLLIRREPETGRALLRRAIDAAAAMPEGIEAAKARAYGYALLAMDAGARGEHGRALALLAEEIGVSEPVRCALGIATEQQALLVVARGREGATIGQYSPLSPTSSSGSPLPRDPVPARIGDSLRGCAIVDVIARPPYAGRGALLPREIAWRYRAARVAPAGEQRAVSRSAASRHVVVAGVEPPASLGLPALLPAWPGTADLELRGAAATPERVLAEMADATLIEIHAHGISGAAGADSSFIALSPGRDGRYALTADQVRASPLVAAPVVLLSACRAALTPAHHHQARNLATAFLDAGARAVIASPEPVRDDHAEEFFAGVRDAITRGVAPAIALRDQRVASDRRSDHAWSDQVVVFE